MLSKFPVELQRKHKRYKLELKNLIRMENVARNSIQKLASFYNAHAFLPQCATANWFKHYSGLDQFHFHWFY